MSSVLRTIRILHKARLTRLMFFLIVVYVVVIGFTTLPETPTPEVDTIPGEQISVCSKKK